MDVIFRAILRGENTTVFCAPTAGTSEPQKHDAQKADRRENITAPWQRGHRYFHLPRQRGRQAVGLRQTAFGTGSGKRLRSFRERACVSVPSLPAGPGHGYHPAGGKVLAWGSRTQNRSPSPSSAPEVPDLEAWISRWRTP